MHSIPLEFGRISSHPSHQQESIPLIYTCKKKVTHKRTQHSSKADLISLTKRTTPWKAQNNGGRREKGRGGVGIASLPSFLSFPSLRLHVYIFSISGYIFLAMILLDLLHGRGVWSVLPSRREKRGFEMVKPKINSVIVFRF